MSEGYESNNLIQCVFISSSLLSDAHCPYMGIGACEVKKSRDSGGAGEREEVSQGWNEVGILYRQNLF